MEALKAKLMEQLKAELENKTEVEKVKNEKTGNCLHDLRTAFITKVPQGLKERKSFILKVVKIDVRQSNVENLIDWLRKNDRQDRADEVEQNKDKFFDISIIADDGTTEISNSSILAFDKSNSLDKLVVKSKNGFDYYVSSMSWDASAKELVFA